MRAKKRRALQLLIGPTLEIVELTSIEFDRV